MVSTKAHADIFRFMVHDLYEAPNDKMNLIAGIKDRVERLEQLEKHEKFARKYIKEHTDLNNPEFNPDKIIEEYKRRRMCGCQ